MSATLKPTGLTPDKSVGYDIAHSLRAGSALPEPLYRLGVTIFGQRGMNEMIYIVGLYSAGCASCRGYIFRAKYFQLPYSEGFGHDGNTFEGLRHSGLAIRGGEYERDCPIHHREPCTRWMVLHSADAARIRASVALE
jgi:hypothetical protein